MIKIYKSIILFTAVLFSVSFLKAQNIVDVYVYHGAGNTTILWDNNKQQFISDIPILKHKGQTVNIKIVNPNPIFYSYEFKQSDIEVKDDFPDISALVGAANQLFSSVVGMADVSGYQDMVTTLATEITKAKSIIQDSDIPESLSDAMAGLKSGGLKLAIRRINNKDELPNGEGHFNSPNLADDLSKSLANVGEMNTFLKEAFVALNASYVQRVNELKALISSKNVQEEITNTFTVTEKPSKIVLVIKPKDPNKKDLQRDIKEITIATLQPYFERTAVELIPVANIQFANNVSDFYLENGIVRERFKDDVSMTPGIILNVNLARFGEIKEMAVGLGLGYNISTNQNQFNQFSLSSIFSYKNFIRVGVGVGYSTYPSGLKDGGKVDAPLPGEIKDLKDIITYDNKAAFFISFSFTGLKLK